MTTNTFRKCLPAFLLPFLFSCGGLGGLLDVDRLARFPPMPYRLAVGGGAILRVEERLSSGEEQKVSADGQWRPTNGLRWHHSETCVSSASVVPGIEGSAQGNR